jgi:hypothetical protein
LRLDSSSVQVWWCYWEFSYRVLLLLLLHVFCFWQWNDKRIVKIGSERMCL